MMNWMDEVVKLADWMAVKCMTDWMVAELTERVEGWMAQ